MAPQRVLHVNKPSKSKNTVIWRSFALDCWGLGLHRLREGRHRRYQRKVDQHKKSKPILLMVAIGIVGSDGCWLATVAVISRQTSLAPHFHTRRSPPSQLTLSTPLSPFPSTTFISSLSNPHLLASISTKMSKPHRVAILDDYQNVSLKFGNWPPIEKHATITVFNDTLLSEHDLVARLKPFTIICTMRERTRFPASVLKQLPNLKLLTTTGMGNRSLDIRAANAQGVVVAGTGGAGAATTEHTWGLILGVMRHIAEEDRNTKEGGVWQRTIPTGLKGRTFGLIGLGHLGQASAKYYCCKD